MKGVDMVVVPNRIQRIHQFPHRVFFLHCLFALPTTFALVGIVFLKQTRWDRMSQALELRYFRRRSHVRPFV